MEMKSRGISNVGFHDSSETAESNQWSPTDEQVDAYIRSLEWQEVQKDIGIPPRHAVDHRAAERTRRPFAFTPLFWGLIAVALGCFAWLLQIVHEGFK